MNKKTLLLIGAGGILLYAMSRRTAQLPAGARPMYPGAAYPGGLLAQPGAAGSIGAGVSGLLQGLFSGLRASPVNATGGAYVGPDYATWSAGGLFGSPNYNPALDTPALLGPVYSPTPNYYATWSPGGLFGTPGYDPRNDAAA
jgi:hypothetical protein